MRGYKAYDKGLTCRGFQFEVGKEYGLDTDPVKCTNTGFHFCKNPLDVLNYYDLCDSEFTVVEAIGKIDEEGKGTKVATNKIKIGAKLDLKCFIKASIECVSESCKSDNNQSSGSAKLATSGDYAQLAASGDYAKLAASGRYAQLAASGRSAKLAASGDYAKLAASGRYAQLAASGRYAQLAASGYCAKLDMQGKNSVGANIGYNAKIKGVVGTWITLAEYKEGVCICVKSAQIDGVKLLADTWYELKNKKFKVVE
jgi:hypothetical protein